MVIVSVLETVGGSFIALCVASFVCGGCVNTHYFFDAPLISYSGVVMVGIVSILRCVGCYDVRCVIGLHE